MGDMVGMGGPCILMCMCSPYHLKAERGVKGWTRHSNRTSDLGTDVVPMVC